MLRHIWIRATRPLTRQNMMKRYNYTARQYQPVQILLMLITIAGWLTTSEAAIQRPVSDFTKVLDVNPKLTDVYYNRGLANFKKGHQEKAIEDYTKALSLNSTLAEAYLNRGIAYAYNSQYDEAIDDYNKAIIVKPNYEAAYFNRGVAYVRKAAADFSKVCTMGNQAACENLKQISD